MSSPPGAPPSLADVARRLLARPDVEAYALVGGEAVRVRRVEVEQGAPVVAVPGWRWPSDEPDVVGEPVLRDRPRLAQVRLVGWWSPASPSYATGVRLRMDVATATVRDEDRQLELDAADGLTELFR